MLSCNLIIVTVCCENLDELSTERLHSMKLQEI